MSKEEIGRPNEVSRCEFLKGTGAALVVVATTPDGGLAAAQVESRSDVNTAASGRCLMFKSCAWWDRQWLTAE